MFEVALTATARQAANECPAQNSLEAPFAVEDGAVTWELTTSADRLSALDDTLEENAIAYRLERGYYDVPREATLTAVASHLEIDV
ncbi:bacterio-opsin activator [Natronococcus jeotgali]|uniref:Bacterio-opsin activator HTH domain-containing protein n=1 Tax=Natronococcus jeotgali DSM 18795 TaxID=1227498 RepID=L9XXB7_9EURY|nr:bacterio-opsin activator [Natronococcus jeotgali]ELY66474.1 Bacterio-opsin activator HTH domain-containing protein [Natronococcus jeotgali DSM 18795]